MADDVADVSDDTEQIEKNESDLDYLNRVGEDISEETETEEPETEEASSEEEEAEEEKTEEEKEETPLEAKDIVNKLNKDYPDLLKKNPEVRRAIFRDAQYSSVFSSPDEAKEVVENYENFYRLSQNILSGKASPLLNAVSETSSESLERFSSNFLPALLKKSPDLYFKTTEPIVRRVLAQVQKEGERRQDKNLVLAVKHIANLIYDDTELPQDQKPTIDPEKEQLKRTLSERQRQDFSNFAESTQDETHEYLASQVLNATRDLQATNMQRMSYIDTVMEALGEQLEADRDHMRRMSSLVNRAHAEGYTPAIKKALQAQYVTRARLYLPNLISKYKKEYFGISKQVIKSNKPQIPAGGGGNKRPAGKATDKQLANKMSDRDFLMRNVK